MVGQGAFERLHEKVQRWIVRQNWQGLREVQERSIPLILEAERDIVIMATTAGGKTEAAFLPITSRLAGEQARAGGGFRAIYVSPLRALINDQFGRMESLCAELDVEVTKWHGDVSAGVKARARKNPGGILLITPESLEAMLIRRGNEVGRLFRALSYVVIDEMHVFLEDPRGKQLQSVLHRIDLTCGVRPVRIGLSATLADDGAARAFIRPRDPSRVILLPPDPSGPQVQLQLRGYVTPATSLHEMRRNRDFNSPEVPADPAQTAMVQHLFDIHRGHRNLIFAGARGCVETVAVKLAEMSETAGVPEEFLAHHGSLSREIREEAERRMKDTTRPCSIVCTTTLELGIDVGDIEAVAQLGPGHTVSGMRQRLGRSGRRPGQAAVMRVYVKEAELTAATHPLDALRAKTVQAIAMLDLMLQSWNEPPEPDRLHLSTLLHQVMALIGQRGGVSPEEAWDILGGGGPFPAVDLGLFKRLLRRMGSADVGLIEQAPDGTLLPGPIGERLLASRDIFSVFTSPGEYRVTAADGRAIGQVSGTFPVAPEQLMVLAGRRWRIIEVDAKRREISVRPSRGGHPPHFGGTAGPPATRVVEEMRRVYADFMIPIYLDGAARQLLTEARTTYDKLGLRNSCVIRHDGQLLLFPWTGGRCHQALVLALTRAGLKPTQLGLAVSVSTEKGRELGAELGRLAAEPPPDALQLAALVNNKPVEKFDPFLGDELMTLAWARDRIDVESLPGLAAMLLESMPKEKTS